MKTNPPNSAKLISMIREATPYIVRFAPKIIVLQVDPCHHDAIVGAYTTV